MGAVGAAGDAYACGICGAEVKIVRNPVADPKCPTLRGIHIAEVADLDMQIQDGKVQAYRAKVKLSFKYKGE